MIPQIVISGTGLFTPPESISNEELVVSFNRYVNEFNKTHREKIETGEMELLQESSSEFIVKASGIKQRYVIDKTGILDVNRMVPNIPARSDQEMSVQCEMAVEASREALVNAGKSGSDVDAVIVACSNLQRAYPAVAIEVQQALGSRGYAYDMNVACSSATFGIQAAVDAIANGSASSVLVVNPEICSGHLDFRDRDSHFIFGDACTALLVENAKTCKAQTAFEVINTRLRTQFSNNIRNNSGFLNRAQTTDIQGQVDYLFHQNGRSVFKEVVPMVAAHILQHLEQVGLTSPDIKRFWLHQANLNMNQLICKKIVGKACDNDLAPIILDKYANTSSAGSMIAFHKTHDDFHAGETGVICSFGAGYSIGSVIVRKVDVH